MLRSRSRLAPLLQWCPCVARPLRIPTSHDPPTKRCPVPAGRFENRCAGRSARKPAPAAIAVPGRPLALHTGPPRRWRSPRAQASLPSVVPMGTRSSGIVVPLQGSARAHGAGRFGFSHGDEPLAPNSPPRRRFAGSGAGLANHDAIQAWFSRRGAQDFPPGDWLNSSSSCWGHTKQLTIPGAGCWRRDEKALVKPGRNERKPGGGWWKGNVSFGPEISKR